MPCVDCASEIEQWGLERLGLLLQLFTTGFASGTQRLANIGEVAERDRGLLSDWLLGGMNRWNRCSFPGGRAHHGYGWREPERMGCGGADKRHTVGERIVVDAQPVAAGGNGTRQFLVPPSEGGAEVSGGA